MPFRLVSRVEPIFALGWGVLAKRRERSEKFHGVQVPEKRISSGVQEWVR